ncbi:MAG: hypothetical protein OEV91_02315 [Desulfobulbaceae bacterium]|nr:hypothetical protein [Desulfobulbaceae bacterium]
MKIDITRQPPADIYRGRGKYIWISIALLSLVVCGGGLMIYGIVSDTPPGENLETLALALFVGPAVVFVYYGGKLNAYKGLNPVQKKELADLGRKHAEIAAYCAWVAEAGREPIYAEYEACKDRGEEHQCREILVE